MIRTGAGDLRYASCHVEPKVKWSNETRKRSDRRFSRRAYEALLPCSGPGQCDDDKRWGPWTAGQIIGLRFPKAWKAVGIAPSLEAA
jgi:hypothetical protein